MKRRCSCCEGPFPLTSFSKHGFYRSGKPKLHTRCKSCASRIETIRRLRRALHGGSLREARRLPTLAEVERRHIERAVRLFGSAPAAAKHLRIGHETIYRRLRAYAKLPRLEHGPRLEQLCEIATRLAKLEQLDREAAQRRRDRELDRLAAAERPADAPHRQTITGRMLRG